MTNISPASEHNKFNSYYKDPLNKTGVMLMSYSNEVGTAISEIAPKLGTALWAPAFMYLGADIYDKYKNDKDNYNPSTRRAFKEAVYQGVTNILALPVVIYAGQCAVSPLGRIDKSGISGNAKNEIYKHTRDVIEQIHGDILENFETFKKTIITSLENKITSRNNEKNTINIFKKLYNKIFTKRYTLLHGDKDKKIIFAEENARKAYDIFVALKKQEVEKIPKNIYKKYHQVLPAMKEMFKDGNFAYQASRTALKEYQTSLIFKNKLLKTISGLVTLVVLAKPVNNFVDKHIMKKYIEPGIDRIPSISINDSKIKNIFNEMSNKKKVNFASQNEH